jgi:hypothetical protein
MFLYNIGVYPSSPVVVASWTSRVVVAGWSSWQESLERHCIQ